MHVRISVQRECSFSKVLQAELYAREQVVLGVRITSAKFQRNPTCSFRCADFQNMQFLAMQKHRTRRLYSAITASAFEQQSSVGMPWDAVRVHTVGQAKQGGEALSGG